MRVLTQTLLAKFGQLACDLRMTANQPLLAVTLGSETGDALHRAASALQDDAAELLGTPNLDFEALDREQLQLAFVFCNERFCQLKEADLSALQHLLRERVLAANLTACHLEFVGFEVFAPDKTWLVARFKAPDSLLHLRKSVWRACREFGAAYPDALWLPCIKVGRFRGAKGQVDKITSLDSLASYSPTTPARAFGLTVVSREPDGLACDEWAKALSFVQEDLSDISTPRKPRESRSSSKRASRKHHHQKEEHLELLA